VKYSGYSTLGAAQCKGLLTAQAPRCFRLDGDSLNERQNNSDKIISSACGPVSLWRGAARKDPRCPPPAWGPQGQAEARQDARQPPPTLPQVQLSAGLPSEPGRDKPRRRPPFALLIAALLGAGQAWQTAVGGEQFHLLDGDLVQPREPVGLRLPIGDEKGVEILQV